MKNLKNLLLIASALSFFTGCQEIKLNSCDLDLYVQGVDSESTNISKNMFKNYASDSGWNVDIKSSSDFETRDLEKAYIRVNLDTTQKYHFDQEFKYSARAEVDTYVYSEPMLQFQRNCNNSFSLNIPEKNYSLEKNFTVDVHAVFAKSENPNSDQIIGGLEGKCGWFKMDSFYKWTSPKTFPKCIKK